MLIMLAANVCNKIKHLGALLFVISIGLTQCSAKSYSDFSQEKNNIKLSVHPLSAAEMRTLFNCYNPVKILGLTSYYQALEITVENRTAQEYLLAQSNIDIKIENSLVIKRKVTTNPVIIPIVTAIASTAILISGIGFAVLPSVIFGTALGVTTLNINMQQSNKFSVENIRTKVLDPQHPALIASFSKTKKIIFVTQKNIKNQLTISLESLDCVNKIPFEIMLKGGKSKA